MPDMLNRKIVLAEFSGQSEINRIIYNDVAGLKISSVRLRHKVK